MPTSSLQMMPSGFKATKLYSQIPTDDTGNFTHTRNDVVNRVNRDQELEEIVAHVPHTSFEGGLTCQELHLEKQSINLFTYPVSFDNVYWTAGLSGATIDDNGGDGYSAPSVDYPTDAFKLVESVGGTNHFLEINLTVTNGAVLSESIYAKAAQRSWIELVDGRTLEGYYFDLANGVVGSAQGSPDSFSITPMANGWYRISITTTVPSTLSRFQILLADSDGSNSYSGDGTSGIYIFGAQLEELPCPTSFIYDGTEGSTTTRLTDVCIGAGDASLFSDANTSGVLYVEMAAFADDSTYRMISLSDGATNSVLIYYNNSSNLLKYDHYVGGALQAGLSYNLSDETDFSKIAVRWAVNDFSLWVDGIERDTDTGGSIFGASVLDRFNFSDVDGSSNILSAKVRDLQLKEYLTDSQMLTLTT